MYYKIENKKSDVYKKLYAMREIELKIEKDNKSKLENQFGSFDAFLGIGNQQNFFRVSQYTGFKFSSPQEIDLTAWKLHADFEGVYVPNRRTKAGKAAKKFIDNLEKRWVDDPLIILGVKESTPSYFTFPFVEITGDIIVLYLDDKTNPKDENVIEITKKEFDILLK